MQSGYFTLAFYGATYWGNGYITPAISGIILLTAGNINQKWLLHPYLLGGQELCNGYITTAVIGIPTLSVGGINQKWVLDLCLLGGPGLSNGYITPTFSGVRNAHYGGHKSDLNT